MKVLLVVFFISSVSFAGDDGSKKKGNAGFEAYEAVKIRENRASRLEFDESLVEGTGRQGNFATDIGKARRSKKNHLYKRSVDWTRDMRITAREMRYLR